MAMKRRDGVHYEASGDGLVILDADGTRLITLNPVGSVIWHALDGRRDAGALAADLVDEFVGVSVEELTTDIEVFIESLVAAALVEDG